MFLVHAKTPAGKSSSLATADEKLRYKNSKCAFLKLSHYLISIRFSFTSVRDVALLVTMTWKKRETTILTITVKLFIPACVSR